MGVVVPNAAPKGAPVDAPGLGRVGHVPRDVDLLPQTSTPPRVSLPSSAPRVGAASDPPGNRLPPRRPARRDWTRRESGRLTFMFKLLTPRTLPPCPWFQAVPWDFFRAMLRVTVLW